MCMFFRKLSHNYKLQDPFRPRNNICCCHEVTELWINHDWCEYNHDKHTSCYIPVTQVWSVSFRPNSSGHSQSNSSIHLFYHHRGPPHMQCLCLIFVWTAGCESNVHSRTCSVVSQTVGHLPAHLSASRVMKVWWRASPGHSQAITIL